MQKIEKSTSESKYIGKGAIIFYCGTYEEAKEKLLLSQLEQKRFELVINQYLQEGLQPIIFGKRKISEQKMNKYLAKLLEIKSVNLQQAQELEIEFKNKIEKKIQLEGIIGVSNKIKQNAPKLIEFLKKSQINIWLMSGDTKENTVSTISQFNLYFKNSKVFDFTTNNSDKSAVGILLRNYLAIFKTGMIDSKHPFQNEEIGSIKSTYKKTSPQIKSYYILIDGKTFQIILEDYYLRNHFLFLLQIVQGVAAYEMSPIQKRIFVELIQNKFLQRPNVLAIGSSKNDIQMVKAAKCGIELSYDENIHYNFGDIIMSDIKQLKSLMLYTSKILQEQYIKLISFLFFQHLVIFAQFFCYSFYGRFQQVSLYDQNLFYIYEFALFPVTLFVLLFIFDIDQKAYLLKNPVLYQYQVKKNTKLV